MMRGQRPTPAWLTGLPEWYTYYTDETDIWTAGWTCFLCVTEAHRRVWVTEGHLTGQRHRNQVRYWCHNCGLSVEAALRGHRLQAQPG